MNRVLIFPTILLLALGMFSFWTSRGEGARDEKAIAICFADDIATLDPARMSWANDIRTAMGLWESLVAYDPKTLAPMPGAAEKWEISADGKTYTFHIRANAKWSNGDPVVAKDFLFAWKRVLDPMTAADYANFFFYIRGAKKYYEAMEEYQKKPKEKPLPDFAGVAISTPDEHTIVIELENPCTYYLDLVAFPCYFPLHEKSMAPHLDKDPTVGYRPTWTHPPALVTNGAFKLEEWAFKRYLKLVPNEHYWDRAAVKASAIMITANSDKRGALLSLKHGNIDILTYLPDDVGPELIADQAAGKRKDVNYKPVFGSYYYVFNCQKKPFDDKRVRKAFSLVVEKEKIVENATRLRQKPLNVIVPPGAIPGYESPEGLKRNVEEAQKLLAEAGYPGGKGLEGIELLYNNEAAHEKVAQAIGQMWQEHLGVRVTYKGVERAQFRTDRKNHNFSISRGGWYGDYTDPTTWLDLCNSKDNNNDAKFANAEYDKLLAQASAETDPAKRFAILKSAEKILVEDEFPFLPLYQYSDGFMFDGDKVGGVYMNVRLLTQFKYLYRK